MTRVLVTGGLGYIGGRLADYLMRTGKYDGIWISTRRQEGLLPAWTKPFEVVEFDLLDKEGLGRALADIHPDYVVHLAAVNEVESMRCPERAVEVNVLGTYNLLVQCSAKCAGGFIYASTFHVYGASSEVSISETTPAQPFHPYAITHLAAEGLVRFFRRYHKLNGLILRLSNAYGYPMHREVDRWMLVANDFCRQAVVNGNIALKSSGEQYRDFITLHDVARAVDYCISIGPERWDAAPYNLGGQCTMSIRELAHKVAEAYSRRYGTAPCPVLVGPEDPAGTWRHPFKYSIDKLEALGFKLEGNMGAEITQTIALCEGFRNA